MVREFRIGEVFGKSLSVLSGNFLPFLIIGVVVHLPLIAYELYHANAVASSVRQPGPEFLYNLITIASNLLLTPIQTGAVTYGVFQQLRGRRASVGECLSAGFSRLLPVIGVAIVSGMIAFVGLLLLIVPGIIFACMFYVSVPAAVVEQQGVTDSLQRSRTLTKDNRLKVFGLILLYTLIGAAIGAAIGFIFGLGRQPIAFTVAILLTRIVLGIWQSTAVCISYFYLRSMKESVDIEEVASVFD